MERTYAANVRGADQIKVCGFVDTIRNKSKMAFIVLKDITGKVQVTVEKNEDPELDAAVNSLLNGTLLYNPDTVCAHHHHEDGHDCGSHSCGEDKHGCAGNH